MSSSGTPEQGRPPIDVLWPPETWPRLCVLAVLAATALIFIPDIRRHYDFPKFYALRLFLLLGLLTWWAARPRSRAFNNPFGPAFGLWLLGSGLSAFAAVNLAESLDVRYFIDNLLCYFLVCLVINSFLNARHLEQFLFVVVASAIVVSIYGVMHLYNIDPLRLVTNRIPVSTLGGSNQCSAYHDLVFPLALAWCAFFVISGLRALRARGIELIPVSDAGVRFIGFCAVLFYLAAGGIHMLACYNYGNIYGLCLAFYGMGWAWAIFALLPRLLTALNRDAANNHSTEQRRILLRGAAVITAIVVCMAGCWAYTRTFLGYIIWTKNSNFYRRQVWYGSLQQIRDNPILGAGPGNYQIAHPLYESLAEREILGREVLARDAHNDLLEQVSEGGLLAAVGLFWLMALVVCVLWGNFLGLERLRDQIESSRAPPCRAERLERFRLFNFWLAIGLVGSTIAIGFHSQVETVLLWPASKTLWAVMLGVIAVQRRLIRRAESIANAPWEPEARPSSEGSPEAEPLEQSFLEAPHNDAGQAQPQ